MYSEKRCYVLEIGAVVIKKRKKLHKNTINFLHFCLHNSNFPPTSKQTQILTIK